MDNRNARLKRWILLTRNWRLSTEFRRLRPERRVLLARQPFPLHI
jgi:hypothetical protein